MAPESSDRPAAPASPDQAETLAMRTAASPPLPRVPYLLVFDESSARVVRLPADGVLVIGRADDAEVHLDDAAASRHHARLVVTAGTVGIEDLGSRNGTLVNGQRVGPPRPLTTGDTIGVGRVTIVVHAGPPREAGGRTVEVPLLAERAAEELARARRHGRTLSVIVLRFAAAAVPPSVLGTAVARVLQPMELAAWTGPDEIAALLPEVGAESAAHRVALARDALAPIGGAVAAGCATYALDGCNFGALLANARGRAAALPDAAAGPVPNAARELAIGERRALVADPAMQRLFELVERLAGSDLPVLVAGETGVGKDLVALALHHWSPRCAAPFVALNCAAIPLSLMETELFGHERGAFSGALAAKPGLLETAAGGTVFLDEIGELSPEAQSKLLRAVETRRVTRVGDVRERSLDIRLVAATNRDLAADVAAGRFRPDLFYRLRAATVLVPPLRDRSAELPLLARAFLDEACAARGRARMGLAPAAMDLLAAHDWPGNVRELRNLLEYVATTVTEEVVQPRHLVGLRAAGRDETVRTDGDSDGAAPAAAATFRPLAEELRELEQLRIGQALAATGGHQGRAARLLHVPPRTFTHKLRQYRLAAPSSAKRDD
jgi:DNA-binding NtrC family response regulator